MTESWLRIGCYLTGYKYRLVKQCSIATEKAVSKYTSAIIIVSLVWFFIGYSFVSRYLRGNTFESLGGALILVVVVIQIERQIILTFGNLKFIKWFRGLLAFVMAIIGSVIIDQITFKQDIKTQRVSFVDSLVKKGMITRGEALQEQITKMDSDISRATVEIKLLSTDLQKNPVLTTVNKTSQRFSYDSLRNNVSTQTIQIPNPSGARVSQLNDIINDSRSRQTALITKKLSLEADLKQEYESAIGFVDELNILIKILKGSTAGFIFWILLIFFFLSIELLVLFAKLADDKNDYEKIVLHQANFRIAQLNAISAGK